MDFEHQHAATTFPDIKSKGLCGRGPPVPAEIGQWRPPYKFTESLGEADEGQVKLPVSTSSIAFQVHRDILGLKGAEPCPWRILSRVHARHQPLHVQTGQTNISKDKLPLGAAMQQIQTPQSISKLHFKIPGLLFRCKLWQRLLHSFLIILHIHLHFTSTACGIGRTTTYWPWNDHALE